YRNCAGRFPGTDIFQHLHPVKLRHHQIQQDDIRWISVEPFNRYRAIGCNLGAESLSLEAVAINFRHQRAIFGDQDSFHETATAPAGARDLRNSLINWRTRSSCTLNSWRTSAAP